MMMTTRFRAAAALWLTCAAAALPAAAAGGDPMVQDALEANMQPVADAQLDTVFAVPDLDLARYSSVMLEPVTINYQRGAGRMYRLNQADMENLQRRARAALERQLSGNGGYKVVDKPGPHTLIVRASLQNVWLAFSRDAGQPGRSRTFADYAVKMSLEAELIDAQTDEVLMIVADRQGDRLSATPRQVTGVDAWAQADKAFNYWAKVLRQRLDAARAKKKP
jgi:hypothetical protein